MKSQIAEIHDVLIELYIMMNQPQRDTALLRQAGVVLDRALFPLLVGIEKKGPIGVVDLADLVGRDYTTVSRQVSKLDELSLIERQNSKCDSRKKEASLTQKGRDLTNKISLAREEKAAAVLSEWNMKDLVKLTSLMRRLVLDMQTDGKAQNLE